MATQQNIGSSAVRSTAGRHGPADLQSIIVFLAENLGHRLLALTVGVDHRTVGRWVADQARTPHFETEHRLRAAYQVFQQLQQVEASATVRAWFMGMNPQLDDASPAEAIRDGHARDVASAARTFINAG